MELELPSLKVTNNKVYICTLSDLDIDNVLNYIYVPNGLYNFKDLGEDNGYYWCKSDEEDTKPDSNMIINTRSYNNEYLRGTYYNGESYNSELIKIKNTLLKIKKSVYINSNEDDKWDLKEYTKDDEIITKYNNYPLMFYLTDKIFVDEEHPLELEFRNKTITNDKIIYEIIYNYMFVGYVIKTELINVVTQQAGIWISLKGNTKKDFEVISFGNYTPEEYDKDLIESNYCSKITSYTPCIGYNNSDSESDSESEFESDIDIHLAQLIDFVNKLPIRKKRKVKISLADFTKDNIIDTE